jgi:hypothetical protein
VVALDDVDLGEGPHSGRRRPWCVRVPPTATKAMERAMSGIALGWGFRGSRGGGDEVERFLFYCGRCVVFTDYSAAT